MPDVLSGHYLRGLGPEWLLPVLASARSDPCPALLFHVVFAEYDHWIHIIGVPRLMCCITALCVMMFYVLYCSLIYRCLLPSRFLNRKRFCVQYVFVSLSLSLYIINIRLLYARVLHASHEIDHTAVWTVDENLFGQGMPRVRGFGITWMLVILLLRQENSQPSHKLCRKMQGALLERLME